ncbi:MAG: nucleoside triphosphate pyrophosphohydrolase [Rhodobacteraceae bacterium]|nr:nucleoside triphosphate pyrophosphohydrolase [Paracoccaceae bacterium]
MVYNQKLVRDPKGGMARLLEIIRALRDPDHGCPWDIEQDFKSIAAYTIEEAYEVDDAIQKKNWSALKSELGDLLFQTVYHSQIASEQNLFKFDDIANSIGDKMLARHPHVFTDERYIKSADKQVADWENIKAHERESADSRGVLDEVALALPALMRAIKLQKRAARVGFDWPDINLVLKKVIEEAQEMVEAKESLDYEKTVEEFGDLLFVLVNFGRHLKIDAEEALRNANAKFTRRFNYIESELAKDNRTPNMASLSEMELLWNKAKFLEQKT